MHHHQVLEPMLTPRSNISSLLSASLFSQLYQPIPARHCQRISQADAAKGFHLATAKEGGFKYTFTVKLKIMRECHEAQDLLSKTESRFQGLDHVAENVLSFLDARSLCAAELVSKEWLRVISEVGIYILT